MERIVLVCVTAQRECERLILAGGELARAESLPLHVLHVMETGAGGIGGPGEEQTLNRLYALAREAGAEMTLLSARDAKTAIADYARKNNACCLVLGCDRQGAWRMADALQGMLGKGVRILRA